MKKKVCLHDQIDEKILIIYGFSEYMTFLHLIYRRDKKSFYISHFKKMFLIHGNQTTHDSDFSI